MNELDDRIRRALGDQGGDFDPGDRPLFSQLADTFKGRGWWISAGATFYVFLFFGLAIWCVYLFFRADEVRYMIFWAAAALWLLLAVGHLKLWLWMRMDRNAVLREVKRLELAVTLMSERLEGGEQRERREK